MSLVLSLVLSFYCQWYCHVLSTYDRNLDTQATRIWKRTFKPGVQLVIPRRHTQKEYRVRWPRRSRLLCTWGSCEDFCGYAKLETVALRYYFIMGIQNATSSRTCSKVLSVPHRYAFRFYAMLALLEGGTTYLRNRPEARLNNLIMQWTFYG